MTDLQRIGLANKTDKADNNHTFQGQSYLDVYEQHFAPLRKLPITLLEIGVHRGGSLKTWRDYFPLGLITGLDINPSAFQDYGPRIQVYIGSQTDPTAISGITPLAFDIIIDDGSHRVDHILTSLKLLWARLRPGGTYVIEDLSLSYLGDISGYRDKWLGQSLNPQDKTCFNDRSKINRLILDILNRMDHLSGDVRSIHFHPMMAVIRKT